MGLGFRRRCKKDSPKKGVRSTGFIKKSYPTLKVSGSSVLVCSVRGFSG